VHFDVECLNHALIEFDHFWKGVRLLKVDALRHFYEIAHSIDFVTQVSSFFLDTKQT